MAQTRSAAADQTTPDDLISFLKAIPNGRYRRGVRYPQWFLLLVAVLGILSGCRSSREFKAFARRHREALNESLGFDFKRWPSDATFLYLFNKAHLRNSARRTVRRHLFLTSIRTTPDALLRLIRQRWSIEHEWHWARDAQLGEDAHRYANRTAAPVCSFLRTVVMNLLRRGGYRSIRQGRRELAYDIKGMLALGGVTTAGTTS
jgi:hypothetical protein